MSTVADDIDGAVREFHRRCRARRVPRAAMRAWPELGERLAGMVYGESVDVLLAALGREPPKRRGEIARGLAAAARFEAATEPLILTLGSANAEHMLTLPGDFEVGQKHIVAVDELYGGSGVNHSLRLLCAGFDVFPLLPVGEDAIGAQIRARLLEAARAGGATDRVCRFLDPSPPGAFFDPYISTPTSTVVVDGKQRTILSQELRHGERFVEHIERRIADLSVLEPRGPSALMIGHLHSDGPKLNPDCPGRCTAYALERFGSSALTFANFGNSQIALGFDFWKRQGLLSKIDVFQLNLGEAKRFFAEGFDERRPLPSIVDTLRREEMTAIITLDRFGALGVHRALADSVIVAWPALGSQDVKDATGAGDAFAAGVMSHLCEHGKATPGAFQTAIEVGRIWAAKACATLGAVGDCPGQVELHEFARSLPGDRRNASEVRIPDHAREIIALLDIAFQ